MIALKSLYNPTSGPYQGRSYCLLFHSLCMGHIFSSFYACVIIFFCCCWKLYVLGNSNCSNSGFQFPSCLLELVFIVCLFSNLVRLFWWSLFPFLSHPLVVSCSWGWKLRCTEPPWNDSGFSKLNEAYILQTRNGRLVPRRVLIVLFHFCTLF